MLMENNYLVFLMKVNIIFSVLYLMYYIFYRKLNYNYLNRFILLSIPLTSFIIPALHVHVTQVNNFSDISMVLEQFYEPAILTRKTNVTDYHSFVSTRFVLFSIYSCGIFVFAFSMFFHIRFIVNFRKKCQSHYFHGQKLYSLKGNHSPFSCFKWIFIPEKLLTSKDLNIIIYHEKVHVKQWHTFDLILSELFCILCWFNPLVFLLKKSVKNIHEFIADKEVVNNCSSVQDYLQLLSQQIQLKMFCRLTSSFNFLTFKNRIEMITNNKISKFRLSAYVLIFPVLFMLSVAFTPKENQNKENTPNISPIEKQSITKISVYGKRVHPITGVEHLHSGIDFAAKEGIPVVATANGNVVKAYHNKHGHGNLVFIKHNDTFSTFYSHLSEIKVKPGQKVMKGDVIGLVGNTGLSAGPHLHYEVWKNDEKVDPALYIPE